MLKIRKLDELERYINEIKRMYENNISLKEIGNYYGCSRDTIKRFITKHNFSDRGKINLLYKNFSEEDDKRIKGLYSNGYSTRIIGKIMNTSGVTISKHLQKMGIEIRDLHTSRQEYKFNEDYFELIDDEHKAYWLGFIAADGCVLEPTFTISKRTGQRIKKEQGILQIGLQEADKKHIEKFQNDIQDIRPIYCNKAQKSVNVKFPSNKMCFDLQKYGIIPRKSLVLEFPHNIPKDLIRHFIRGYFDGDGSIAFCKNKKGIISIGSISVSFIGATSFIKELKNILQRFSINGIFIKENNPLTLNLFFTSISQTKQFLDFIYKDATIYLDRKYERYLIFNKKYEEYVKKNLRK